MTEDCVKRHDLFLVDFGIEAIHWTGVHFSCNLEDEIIDAAVLEITKLRSADKERLLNRWEEFKQAQIFVEQTKEWLGGDSGDTETMLARVRTLVSNFSLDGPLANYEFTDLVPTEIKRRWRFSHRLIKEVYDDRCDCIVTKHPGGVFSFSLDYPRL